MKIDNFTRITLGVIAINLTMLTFTNLNIIPTAKASQDEIDFKVNPSVNYGLVPINEDGTINVRLSSSNELDVNITGIDTRDELDINIDEIGSERVSYGGPIAVELKQ